MSSDGQGQLSCYWFSQGTPDNFPECDGYKTHCGYFSAVAKTASGTLEGTMNTGFWSFGGEVGGAEVTLTDVLGHTITGTIPTSDEGGSIGAQFDLGCG